MDIKNLSIKQLKIYIDFFALSAGIALRHRKMDKFHEENNKKERLEKELLSRTHQPKQEQELC